MTPEKPSQPDRPDDVVTGFWLWAVALPLLLTGFLCDALTAPTAAPVTNGLMVGFAGVLGIVVLTFLLLMRAGYRWARTVLTAGAVVSILYMAGGLLTVQRPTVAAVVFAGTGIVGAVLLGGGIVLLHRKDGHGYFTR